eukprot:CAMPEP_0113593742 /NCGR_PEP_ID=MMETSP0015_2-20120614/38635_1 /TAXON_ID=2838 /ORGANISM="Odontella" /LENGTH=70 /DNA_ID=CAMNT_0000500551 /DNA_START=1 /DNA_END=209 /DNA_ORIENTATION=+ /assembly_acc=CAM_ASM_000160
MSVCGATQLTLVLSVVVTELSSHAHASSSDSTLPPVSPIIAVRTVPCYVRLSAESVLPAAEGATKVVSGG